MKQKLTVIALLIAGIAVLLLIYIRFPQNDKVDAQKIFIAAQTHTRQLQEQGKAIPDSINLKELIALRLLQPSDVAGFSGADVTVSLIANSNGPDAVLMRARFPDGQEMLVMGDGSVRPR